ncbi:MAG: hypothetical protein MMC33_010296 [Icmadophila ericetorum]|nr:hypothetical protein [Icmadophila ericetorum]
MSGPSALKPSEDLQEWVEKTAISTLTVDIRRLEIRRDIQLRPGISLALNKVTGKVAALGEYDLHDNTIYLPSKHSSTRPSVKRRTKRHFLHPSKQATDPFSIPAEKRKNQESNEPKEALSTEASFPPLKRPRYQQVDNKLRLSVTISRTLKPVKEYHIFGDFALPHPSNLELPEALRDLALDWEQAFKNINDHDFLAIQKPIPDVSEYFVQPLGMLDSLLAHHLHQPSMTTTKLKDGAIVDGSNGCIRMIMNNGYKQGETLIFDHLHRRSKKSDGVKTYPHEKLHHYLRADGARKSITPHANRAHHIPLWDRADGVFLVLFHEKSFSNAEPGHKIRRIGLFASHPQCLFYEPQDSPIAQMQDKIIGIATEMVPGAVPVIEKYYSKKKWLSNNVTTLKSFAQIDTDIPSDEMTSLQDLSLSTSTRGPELTKRSSSLLRPVLTFSECPHSVKTLLDEVLPSAIQALRSDKSEWKHFSDVPADVLKWLEGIKQSVFPNFEIIELEYISKALDQTLFKSNVHGNGNLSNKKAILKLMLAQQEQLQATSGNYPNLFFVRLEASEVNIKCQKYAEPFSTDDSPRWATNRPNYYYMKLRAGASDARNAPELLEEETSTLISFQGGPVEQETFSMSNENQHVSFAKKSTGNLADLSR